MVQLVDDDGVFFLGRWIANCQQCDLPFSRHARMREPFKYALLQCYFKEGHSVPKKYSIIGAIVRMIAQKLGAKKAHLLEKIQVDDN